MSALISRATSTMQRQMWKIAGNNIKAYSRHYIVCQSLWTLYFIHQIHQMHELIDACGVIWPIMLEVAFTATIVLLCDKILIIRGPPNIFRPRPKTKPLLCPWSGVFNSCSLNALINYTSFIYPIQLKSNIIKLCSLTNHIIYFL